MKNQFKLAGALLAIMMSATSITNAQWQTTGNTTLNSTDYLGTGSGVNQDLRIKLNGTQRMTVKYSSGNVGIGTTSPSCRLQVSGNATAGVSGNGIFTIASTATGGAQMRFDGNRIQTVLSTVLPVSASSIAINPDGGKVAIGTTSPEAKLHVRSDANERAFQVGINGTTKLMVEYNGGTSIGYTSGNTPPADGLIVNGNVGIGYTSLSSKLTVNGDESQTAFSVKNNDYTNLRVTSNGGVAIGENMPSGYATTFAPPSRGLFVEGTVDIGKQNGASGYKLSVDGKVICEELRVENSSNWPDYVFANDYKLMPLEEVEKSIKENKHLPGIPSACEVAENGLLIGEMQHKMMEKIEQLTLYIIELKHQKDELSNRLSQLENK